MGIVIVIIPFLVGIAARMRSIVRFVVGVLMALGIA